MNEYRDTITSFEPRAAELYRIFDEHNERYFGGELPELPLLVVQALPYGHCLGQTLISRPVPVIEIGQRQVHERPEHLLVHEMLHAYLHLRDENVRHNGKPWCRELERITPLYLGFEIRATPQTVKRVNGKPQRWTPDGHLTRKELSGWPYSLVESCGELELPDVTRNWV